MKATIVYWVIAIIGIFFAIDEPLLTFPHFFNNFVKKFLMENNIFFKIIANLFVLSITIGWIVLVIKVFWELAFKDIFRKSPKHKLHDKDTKTVIFNIYMNSGKDECEK
ncbi:MAG TPA: hypothetical protein PKW80_12195 [Bacteroidales bacterium]|nr:hypothetical protein [Bacteroidales bacterium]